MTDDRLASRIPANEEQEAERRADDERYMRQMLGDTLFEANVTERGRIEWRRKSPKTGKWLFLPGSAEQLADYLVAEMQYSDAHHYGSYEVQLLLTAIVENGVPHYCDGPPYRNFIGKLLLPRVFKANLSEKFLARVFEWVGEPRTFCRQHRRTDGSMQVELVYHSFVNAS